MKIARCLRDTVGRGSAAVSALSIVPVIPSVPISLKFSFV